MNRKPRIPAILPPALIVSGLLLALLGWWLGDRHGFPGWVLTLCGGLDVLAGIGLAWWAPRAGRTIDNEEKR